MGNHADPLSTVIQTWKILGIKTKNKYLAIKFMQMSNLAHEKLDLVLFEQKH